MPVDKRILLIANYPIKNPMHGGQKRAAAMYREYKKTFSAVKFVAVFVREHYPDYSAGDIYLTGKWAEKVREDHLTSDIQVARAMTENPSVKRRLKRLILSFKPDIIEVEQVFPYIGLREVLKELGVSPKIVFNSQNAEAPMRRDIMAIGNAAQKDINAAVGIIHEAEAELAQTADYISAVSQNDCSYYEGLGAKDCKLAPNGISATTASEKSLQYWKNYFSVRGVKKTVLFVASAHLPNVQGLNKVVGRRLGYLDFDTRLILAGSVGRNFKEHIDASTNILDKTFWRRAIDVGTLSEELLSGLLQFADVILLPLVDGGGSNLKTAEAILSGKKVVGTTFAFRGYEQYQTLPNVWVTKDAREFRAKVSEALKTPSVDRTLNESRLAEKVEWQYCLKPMISEVAKL
ncbi:N/A [soil metagenome]